MKQLELIPTEIPRVNNLKGAVVRQVNRATAEKVVVQEHYSHDLPPRAWLHYGLYTENNLAGVACFGGVMRGGWHIIPPIKSDGNILELVKLAIYRWAPKNSGSFLISKSLKLLALMKKNMLVVIAYSDPIQDHIGFVYQSCNWVYLGKQDESSSQWADDNGNLTHQRLLYGKGQPKPSDLNLRKVILPKKFLYIYQLQHNEEVTFWVDQLKQPYPKRLSSKDKILTDQVRDACSNQSQPLQGRNNASL